MKYFFYKFGENFYNLFSKIYNLFSKIITVIEFHDRDCEYVMLENEESLLRVNL